MARRSDNWLPSRFYLSRQVLGWAFIAILLFGSNVVVNLFSTAIEPTLRAWLGAIYPLALGVLFVLALSLTVQQPVGLKGTVIYASVVQRNSSIEIELAERMTWSWKRVLQSGWGGVRIRGIYGLILGLIGGLSGGRPAGAIGSLLGGVSERLGGGLALALITALVIALSGGLI